MLIRRRLVLYFFTAFALTYFFGYFFIAFQLTTSNSGTVVDLQWRLIDAEQRLVNQLRQHANLLQILQGTKDEIKETMTLPVLLMACNRPENLDRTLKQVIKYTNSSRTPPAVSLPVIVSQDCGDVRTANLIRTYHQFNITHLEQPDRRDLGTNLTKNDRRFLGYYNIARHYKWALDQVFISLNFSAAIIIEDDLDLSPDFFEYFVATLPLLRADPTLWCVSAWNDNGKINLVSAEPELLYRTDFFPGLGWMLLKSTWLELRSKWPAVFWDDWMRKPDQRRSRACIRPEIPRSSTFGRLGTSNGQFYDSYLQYIKQYDGFVSFTQRSLSFLMKENYDKQFLKMVYSKPTIDVDAINRIAQQQNVTAVRIEYTDLESLRRVTRALGLMTDCKAGVPRMAYKGIVSVFLSGIRIYVSPPESWSGYDESWT